MALTSENFARPKLATTLNTEVVISTEANEDDTNSGVVIGSARVDFYYDDYDGLGNDKLVLRAVLPIAVEGVNAYLKDIKVYTFAGDEANWATGGQTPADSTAENFGATTGLVIGSSSKVNLDTFLTAAGVARTNS